ncbi:hypothetical protein GLO26_07235 [Carnobacterium inhibens]|uniref:DUF5626 domain-containing protein n=1 Tax=Carnobacterium inhibens TaxID=147709 RepID=A0ABR7TCC3_9LACT|nr:hypothetical protein [Carnobacterium inhibens]
MVGGIHLKKLIFLLSSLAFFSFFTATKVQAEESFPSPESSVFYDLNQGGLQQFEVENDLGETYTITIEEEPQFFIMASAVKSGTYKITKEKALQWKASYKIDVSNNKITRAHSASATAFTGSFKSLLLKVDSSTQATYYLKRTILLAETSINLRAKLAGSSISITY